ncbi:MAG: acyltransferase [Bacteroidota bacterium]|nr:acyltransferase [Flavisolibacter sp.]MDQ3842975.1 acyltransferase [Bacteroidota bacterium]
MHPISTYFRKGTLLSILRPHQPSVVNQKAVAVKKFEFVDFVRFVSMIGIVWLHCYLTPQGRDKFPPTTDHPLLFILSVQILKFSSICFFIISGFLLSNKLSVEDGFQFYKRRFHSLWRPYAVAFVITFCFYLLRWLVKFHLFQPFELANRLAFHTSFWFVPNLLFALLITIVLLKTTNFFYTGLLTAVLLLISTINTVYLNHEEHTVALFAYAFYLWLGMFIYKKNIIDRVRSMSISVILAALICSFLLAVAESYYFTLHHAAAPITFNTLCFSNQLYSIIAFLFLIRISEYIPAFTLVNPRKETYGIYLYHMIIISIVITATEVIQTSFHFKLYSFNTYPTLALSFINFAICYSLSTLLVKYFVKKKLCYLARE